MSGHPVFKQIASGRPCPLRLDRAARECHCFRAELLFELISLRYETGSTLITSNLPFEEWTDNAGHISRAGDTDVRSALYSVANSLLINTKRMSPLKAWGLKLVRQKGRKRATVAVARKLAVILLRMWIDGSRYRWDDVEVAK